MKNTDAQKSVSSVKQLQRALQSRRIENSSPRARNNSNSEAEFDAKNSIPRFNCSEDKPIEGGLYFINHNRLSKKSEHVARSNEHRNLFSHSLSHDDQIE